MKHAWIAALLLTACGHASSRPVVVRRPPAAPPEPTARYFVRGGGVFRSWWVDERSRPQRAIVDGVRLEVDGASVARADGQLIALLSAVWERDGHWEFVGRSGRWEASSFLGVLRRGTQITAATLGLGSGRTTVVRDGAVEGLTLPPGVVIDAAFGDERHGLAVLEPGRALLTDDGGAHWSPLPLGDDAALEVVALDGRRWVRGDEACYEVRADATVAPVSCDTLPLLHATTPEDAVDAALHRIGTPHADRTLVPLAFTDATRRQVLAWTRATTQPEPRGARSMIYDLERDEIVAGTEADLPCEVEGPDDVFVADRPYLRCPAARGALVLRSLAPDGRWQERLTTWRCGGETGCAASADGARVSCAGRCDAGTGCGDAAWFCEGTAGGARRQWSAGAADRGWRVAGYEGDTAVLLDGREWLAHAEVRRGEGAPARLAPDPAWGGFRELRPPRLGQDGRLRFWAARADGERFVPLEGRPGGPFAERARPPWVGSDDDRVSFLFCGDDGAAVSASPDGYTWISRGPEDQWQRVASDTSDPAFVTVAGDPLTAAPHLSCDAVSWRRNHDWNSRVIGWGRPAASHYGAEAVVRPWGTYDRSQWRCTPRSPPSPMGAAVRVDDRFLSTHGAGLPRESRGSIEVPSFALATLASPAPRVLRYRSAGAGAETAALIWSVVAADARGAIVLAWARDATSSARRVRLLALSPQEPPRTIETLPTWLATGSPSNVRSLVAREGAVTAVLVHEHARDAFDLEDRLSARLVVLRAGAMAGVRRVSLAHDWPPGCYVLDGAAGVARKRPDGSVVGGAPGEAPRVLARLVTAVACGPSARGAFTFPVMATTNEPTDAEPALAEYALDGDALCLRSLRGEEVLAAPGADGVDGVRRDGTPVRCEWP